jgi:2'-5' RNA ligase
MTGREEVVRLFVSVDVPQGLKERVAGLAKELPQDAITPVQPDNMHLTLRFIGGVPERMVGDIMRRLGEVEFRRFSVPLKGAGVFPNESYVRVVWAGCESPELNELAKKVVGALRGIGKEEERGFTAHLTIARVKKKIDPKPFLQKHSQDSFGEFDVPAFYLMRSELRPGVPPKYTIVAAFETKA